MFAKIALARWHGLAYARCQPLKSMVYARLGTVGTGVGANGPKKPNKINAWHVGTLGTPYGGMVAHANHNPPTPGGREILSIILPFTRCAICRDALGDSWQIIAGAKSDIPVCAGCAGRRS